MNELFKRPDDILGLDQQVQVGSFIQTENVEKMQLIWAY